MSRAAAIARAERYFDTGQFREDLARRVAFKTESQVPESRPQLGAYLEREIKPAFELLPNAWRHQYGSADARGVGAMPEDEMEARAALGRGDSLAPPGRCHPSSDSRPDRRSGGK